MGQNSWYMVKLARGTGEKKVVILSLISALMLVSAVAAYVRTNELYGRVTVRNEIIARLNKKAMTTSYPNLFDEKFKKLTAKSQEAVSSNRAPTEAVWTTLTELTTNILGFAFYTVLMSSVQPLLIAILKKTQKNICRFRVMCIYIT